MELMPSCSDARNLQSAYPGIFEDPVSALVSSPNRRSQSSIFRCLVCSTPLPPRSFALLPEGYLIPIPALTVANLARELPPLQLAECASELCSAYRKDPRDPRGMHDRSPVLDIAELRDYLNRASGVTGSKAARRVAPFIVEASASPMETTLALLLCLPKQKGGMGLPKPEMNARITIPPNLRRLAKRGYVRADLLWRRQKVLVEYDSDWAHANTRSLNADAAKRNVLQRMGYTVITLTKDQVNEWGAFWEFASIVSHALRRGQGRDLGDWTNQQVRLWASRGCGTDCPELPFSADDAPSPRLPQPSLLQEPAQSAGS